ncbi:MAG: TetR/AcrR family transcriptional regulator, partial [Clostridia bacterium]|nr:TetR/AcrR family transcriptional regulator [Clostridia bacterium]
YYYFQSKEQILEQVVEMLLHKGLERANGVLGTDLSIPEKIIGVILAFRPIEAEVAIQNTLNQPENVFLHDRVNKKLIGDAVPLLAEIVREGNKQGIFDCEQVEERVKLILIMSSSLFDDGAFSESETIAFVDIVEKTIGAESGTMGFIMKLISGGVNDEENK